jgi:hypothetical protein
MAQAPPQTLIFHGKTRRLSGGREKFRATHLPGVSEHSAQTRTCLWFTTIYPWNGCQAVSCFGSKCGAVWRLMWLKIFISWSGPLSGQVAMVLRDWLPSVLQTIEPYVSSEDIDKGARWIADLSRELESSGYGIVCVTANNVGAPWLNFEAGALSKSFDRARVSPFLYGVGRNNITGPLVQFQSVIFERDDVLRLLKSINAASEVPLENSRLVTTFAVWWPNLQESMAQIEASTTAKDESPPINRSLEDMMIELLDLVRSQQRERVDESLTAASSPFDQKALVRIGSALAQLRALVYGRDSSELSVTQVKHAINFNVKSLEEQLIPELLSKDLYDEIRSALEQVQKEMREQKEVDAS